MSATRFIAFYSYKGGVGRSLALANLAYVLAREGRKVLILDMDLEAPGQHQSDLFRLSSPGPGIVEMLVDYLGYRELLNEGDAAETYHLELDRYLRIGEGWQPHRDRAEKAEVGSLWLMPAGEVDKPDYSERLGRLNWDEFYAQQGSAFFHLFKAELRRRGFDDVLIDSRTGLSDEFYTATLELAETVVCVTGYNRQNVEGTRRALTVLGNPNVVEEYETKRLILVGAPQPLVSQRDLQERISEIEAEWPGFKRFNAQLPYVPEIALRETVLCRRDEEQQPESDYIRGVKELRRLIDTDSNPFSDVASLNQPGNPFALIRSDYITAEETLRHFVDPAGSIVQDMNSFMPLLVTGARGSGKTMLARRFSLEVQLAEHEATGSPIKPENFPRIGLYLRLDADFLHNFNQGDSALRSDFDHLFAQFFDIVVMRKALNALDALSNLNGTSLWCNEAELLRALYAEFGQFEIEKPGLSAFLEFLETHVQSIRFYLNNPFPQHRPVFTQPNALMKLLTERLRRSGRFNGHYFVVLVDEYENYADYQQRIVNTRLKQGRREDGVTYRLFMRSGGLRTRETLAPGQLIEETHDYRRHALDEEMGFEDFKAYALAVANRHLEQTPYFREKALTRLEDMLQDLSPEEEARQMAGGKRASPLVDWVKKRFPQHATDILAWMETEQEPLRQATAIVLLNQGKPVDKVLAAFRSQSKEASDGYHNYSRGALHWLCHLYHQDKRYSGLNQLVGLSGNTIRVFLDFCHAIFAEWLEAGATALPIPHAVQNAAIRRQANIFRENLRSADHSPREVNNLVERLGRLFEAKHKSPKQSEPEVNHFAIPGLDEDERREQLERWLNNAWYEGALRRLEGTKQKSLEDLRLTDWQLVPWFAPLFNLSTRRKKKLTLKPNECFDLFAGDQKTWTKLFKQKERKFEESADIKQGTLL